MITFRSVKCSEVREDKQIKQKHYHIGWRTHLCVIY